ncbi:hypothetical protein PGT21_015678 [Puccinia graminis f. sp. tritici]|uniref:Uncharacterized protein n=1 Tax=Puccinia graminis f. sp. tritici TaxID=56615 RepID=A0A5B0QT85_PUCGR|nr:hypothetical protein PGT21_015678 [Puccinia graminis f. sp. tritici]
MPNILGQKHQFTSGVGASDFVFFLASKFRSLAGLNVSVYRRLLSPNIAQNRLRWYCIDDSRPDCNTNLARIGSRRIEDEAYHNDCSNGPGHGGDRSHSSQKSGDDRGTTMRSTWLL